jgi:hypothetical protein
VTLLAQDVHGGARLVRSNPTNPLGDVSRSGFLRALQQHPIQLRAGVDDDGLTDRHRQLLAVGSRHQTDVVYGIAGAHDLPELGMVDEGLGSDSAAAWLLPRVAGVEDVHGVARTREALCAKCPTGPGSHHCDLHVAHRSGWRHGEPAGDSASLW